MFAQPPPASPPQSSLNLRRASALSLSLQSVQESDAPLTHLACPPPLSCAGWSRPPLSPQPPHPLSSGTCVSRPAASTCSRRAEQRQKHTPSPQARGVEGVRRCHHHARLRACAAVRLLSPSRGYCLERPWEYVQSRKGRRRKRPAETSVPDFVTHTQSEAYLRPWQTRADWRTPHPAPPASYPQALALAPPCKGWGLVIGRCRRGSWGVPTHACLC